MKKAEIILSIIALTGFLLKMLLIPTAGAILSLSLLALSCLYFYLGIAFFNDIPLKKMFKKSSYEGISKGRIFGSIATGIVFSVLVIGVMFWLQLWPGSSAFLLSGIVLLLPIITISLIRNSKTRSDFYKRIFVRAGMFGWLAISLFYFVHKSTYISIIYREYPVYRDALIELYKDQGDKELQKKEREERYKMDEERRKN